MHEVTSLNLTNKYSRSSRKCRHITKAGATYFRLSKCHTDLETRRFWIESAQVIFLSLNSHYVILLLSCLSRFSLYPPTELYLFESRCADNTYMSAVLYSWQIRVLFYKNIKRKLSFGLIFSNILFHKYIYSEQLINFFQKWLFVVAFVKLLSSHRWITFIWRE